MTQTHPQVARARGIRRTGYLIGAGVDLAVLYLLNIEPGWQRLSFVTDDAARVMALVNLSLLVGLVANAALATYDPPWARSLSDLTTSLMGLLVAVRIWRVFPFEFAGTGFDWAQLVRIVLVVAIAGTAIGMVVALARLVFDKPSRSD